MLVIDDDANSRKLVVDALSSIGMSVLGAATGKEGLLLSVERQPAAIILDIRLPDFDGVSLVMKLKEDPRTKLIPVMAVTASALSEDKKRILGSGFSDYMAKPIRILEFRERVLRLVDWH